jgi:hypothetical protein
MDGLYSRVSSERQTRENQFEDVLQVAEKDGYGRDWSQIPEALSRCVIEEHRPGTAGTARTVRESEQAAELARQCLAIFGRSDNRRFGSIITRMVFAISMEESRFTLNGPPFDAARGSHDGRHDSAAFGAARALTSSPRSMAAMVALRYHAD